MDCELEVDLSCSLDVVVEVAGLRGTGLRAVGLRVLGLGVVLLGTVPLGVGVEDLFFSDGGPSMARALGGPSIANFRSGAGRASLGGEGGVRT